MESVTISSKYQVVIPRSVRDSLQLKPGQKVHVIAYADRIELVPERTILEMRGFLKGINTTVEREADRL
jgi:AbrB family looped-hinge helix DNA binding protein